MYKVVSLFDGIGAGRHALNLLNKECEYHAYEVNEPSILVTSSNYEDVIHHDPSGKDMSRDMEDRLQMFGANVQFERIALNFDQIEEYNPPPNPTKLTDSRATGYIDEFGYECWELDALEPRVITELIESKICSVMDEEIYEAAEMRETAERQKMRNFVSKYPDFAEGESIN